MAHFIGYVQGMRGIESRTGSKGSGMTGQAQGWNIGGRVFVYHAHPITTPAKSADKTDHVRFTLTGGSHGMGRDRVLAEAVLTEFGPGVTHYVRPGDTIVHEEA